MLGVAVIDLLADPLDDPGEPLGVGIICLVLAALLIAAGWLWSL